MEIPMLLITPIIEFNILYEVYFLVFQQILFEKHFSSLKKKGSMIGTTVAGITSNPGSSLSQLSNPSSIYVDPNGMMYILDTSNCRVLRWAPGEPLGFLVAGDGSCGSTLTRISTSYGMFVTPSYDIYISDYANHRVTVWSPSNTTSGVLVNFFRKYGFQFKSILFSKVAGGYGWGSTPERLYYPWGIFVDANQALFIADRSNHRIQRWDYGMK